MKYLETMKNVYKSLKHHAYKNQSLYGYKCFPEDDEWFYVIYSDNVLLIRDKINLEHNYVKPDESVWLFATNHHYLE